MNLIASQVVSDESEVLILVDENDRPCGQASKAACHDGSGLLHRAFSVFVFDDRGRTLLQQRSDQKRLWPLRWSTSCCSHPRVGEPMEGAAYRRVEEELGLASDCQYLYKFRYQVDFGDEGAEHEFCWVYATKTRGEVQVNDNEVSDWAYVSRKELDKSIAEDPGKYTPWFVMQWKYITDNHWEEIMALR